MESDPNRPSKDESPGTSFENPLVDFRAQLDLTATRYYALDPTNGIIKTTEAGVPKFYRGNVAILNSDGMRMHVSYDPGRNTYTIVIRYPEQAKDVLSRLNDPHWEFIDVDTALEEAEDDDTIHYDVDIKYFKRRRSSYLDDLDKGLYDGLSDNEKALPASGSGVAAS
ncbi:hypothetical protein J4E86_002736 [Alternaria arbusti]|uniref:uncharacterized protein n=1 Tax=Alternaria arbusti TaxID=232088 RepID=UPI00222028C5|nr:uncharacterized protein J4E86_002736 [Alternaria arbusti]KAI4959016.1 hypothetical protein J4E86_002736 [Alternaria arbusti]